MSKQITLRADPLVEAWLAEVNELADIMPWYKQDILRSLGLQFNETERQSEGPDRMTRKELDEILQEASNQVATWPEWARRLARSRSCLGIAPAEEKESQVTNDKEQKYKLAIDFSDGLYSIRGPKYIDADCELPNFYELFCRSKNLSTLRNELVNLLHVIEEEFAASFTGKIVRMDREALTCTLRAQDPLCYSKFMYANCRYDTSLENFLLHAFNMRNVITITGKNDPAGQHITILGVTTVEGQPWSEQ